MATYEEIIEAHPTLKSVVHQNSWDYIEHSDGVTLKKLEKQWCKNAEENIRNKRYKRHGGLNKDCIGFGKNKAVVAIGAGKSLKKNLHVLKRVHDFDGVKSWDDRNFIFIASNHMFKPLLKEGIIPDFVMIADGSDVIMDQLTKDIPESGRNCVLLSGIQCSPRVLKKWEKQGRDIRFYITMNKSVQKVFEDLTGHKASQIEIHQGGNVLNSCWTLSMALLKSTVFMALGNDMSFMRYDDGEQQRNNYYADGDYSTNIATGRDEASDKQEWMGFSLSHTNIISDDATKRYNIELDRVGTTANLWVYKTWLESRVVALAEMPNTAPFHYYNCTEGGIGGVLCDTQDMVDRAKIENWMMLDTLCKRWKTRMFEDAVSEFLKAKDKFRWGLEFDVPYATGLVRAN